MVWSLEDADGPGAFDSDGSSEERLGHISLIMNAPAAGGLSIVGANPAVICCPQGPRLSEGHSFREHYNATGASH